ncbi:MAG: hypothetical protein ACYTEQ_31270, partial [Planctomycetota bacterium]
KSGVSGIPKKLDDVPTHVVVTGKFYALRKPPWAGGNDEEAVDPTARLDRPVPIGVSTGHPNITAGTIGCRVRKNGEVYALSNNHVYADENNASARVHSMVVLTRTILSVRFPILSRSFFPCLPTT